MNMTKTIKELEKKYKKTDTCRVFLKCTNKATTTIPNPILGDVPACQRCADKMEKLK